MEQAPHLRITDLAAGYGRTEILHGIDLDVESGQVVCLVGPNGAGKSTVLNAIFGFADIYRGSIVFGGQDVTQLAAHAKLQRAHIGYVLQDSSVFSDLSVEDNLRLGAYLASRREGRLAVERIFEDYPRLADRRLQPARVLSGGERRILEVARALMMAPRLLLVDEPTLGLEPRHIDTVFDALDALRRRSALSIVLVEQNAARGLNFADVGCVLVAGKIALTGKGADLAADRSLSQLFLGGERA